MVLNMSFSWSGGGTSMVVDVLGVDMMARSSSSTDDLSSLTGDGGGDFTSTANDVSVGGGGWVTDADGDVLNIVEHSTTSGGGWVMDADGDVLNIVEQSTTSGGGGAGGNDTAERFDGRLLAG